YIIVIYHSYYQHHSHHPYLHSFPTRRSSDLIAATNTDVGGPSDTETTHIADIDLLERAVSCLRVIEAIRQPVAPGLAGILQGQGDRKSTRLNSSHLGISYAVFCLKKKNIRNC